MPRITVVRKLPPSEHSHRSKYDRYFDAAQKGGGYVVTPAKHASSVLSSARRRGLSVTMRNRVVYVFKQRMASRRRRSK